MNLTQCEVCGKKHKLTQFSCESCGWTNRRYITLMVSIGVLILLIAWCAGLYFLATYKPHPAPAR